LRDKMKEAGESSAIMSDETVKAAHAFEVGWERAILSVKAFTAESIVSIGGWAVAIAQAFATAEGDAATFSSALDQQRLKALAPIAPVPSHGGETQTRDAEQAVITTQQLLENRLN